ncbi:MAG: envelope fusion protein [Candidatus Thiodiazotropha endolucinida]|nr:envelope fusion protein [Candidatus Thiodiazotropha taylori]MCW4344196.1 envelope fusion protein [Candidatus Thiodiazotropha endolucinida]
MTPLVPLFLLCQLAQITDSFLLRQNAVFTKISDAGLTRSHWLISMVIELSPYRQYLSKLSDDIQKTQDLVESTAAKFDSPRTPDYRDAISKLGREVNALHVNYIETITGFDKYKMLNPRSKRSLVSIFSPFLHLFGVVTDDQIGSLRQNIATLARNDQKIAHVLEDSLSMINASKLSIDRNRQTINDILDSLTDLDNKLSNITQKLQLDLLELSEFTKLYVQVDIVIEELKRFSFQGVFLLEHFKTQLGFLSLAKLSTEIIDPFQLKQILDGISSRLPPNLKLPYDPVTGLWQYYRSLQVSTFLDEDQMIATITVPLIQYDHSFEIYRVINLGLPLINSSIETSDTHAMVASYQLEAKGIAINVQRTKYVLLDSHQLRECSKPILGTCNLKTAIFPVNLSNKCILALFLDHPEKISKFCKRVIQPNSYLPLAVNLVDGAWIVVTQKILRFSVTCVGQTPSLTTAVIRPPLDTLRLEKRCRAENDYLSLMPFFTSESTEKVTDDLVSLIKDNLNLTSIKIWEPFIKNVSHFKHAHLPNKIKALKSIPMDTLIESLHDLEPMVDDDFWDLPGWVYSLIAVGISMIIGIALFLYCKYCKQPWRLGYLGAIGQVRKEAANATPVNDLSAAERLIETRDDTHTALPSAPTDKEAIEMQEFSKKIYPTFRLSTN